MKNKLKPFNHAFTFRKGKISEDLLALTLKIIVWLCSSACKPGRTNQLLKVLGTISESLIKLSKDRGVRGLILYLKDIRLAYYLYLSGEFPLKKVKGVKVHPSGFPIILKPFYTMARKSPIFRSGSFSSWNPIIDDSLTLY